MHDTRLIGTDEQVQASIHLGFGVLNVALVCSTQPACHQERVIVAP